jgi:hypothetical protein
MSDHRSDEEPMTTAQVDASGQPIDPDRIDAPHAAATDGAGPGPSVTPDEEKVAAQLGDFA